MSAVAASHAHRRKHRLLNRVQLLVYKLFFAHAGKFIVVALYYILTQWFRGQRVHAVLAGRTTDFRLWNIKGRWDKMLSADWAHGGLVHIMSQAAWTPMRHTVFRGLIEGTLGLILFQQIGFNVEKYREKVQKKDGKVRWYNKFFASAYQNHPVTGLQYAFLPVLVLLITILLGVPLYLGFHNGLTHALHATWLEPNLRNANFIQRLYVGDYDGLIIGVIVGAVAVRSYRPYLYANTMNYGRSWVAAGRGPRWWMPFQTRELIRDLCEEGVERQQAKLAERGAAAQRIAFIGVTVSVLLAVYGFYILKAFTK